RWCEMELRESKRYKGYFSDKKGNIYSNRRGSIALKKLRKDKDGYLITNVIDDIKGFETTIRADRKSTRLNSSHVSISYAVFCLNLPSSSHLYTLSLHDALPI